MSSSIMETQLIRSLQTEPELARRGCQIAAATNAGVLISRAGRPRGLWSWRGGSFAFVPHSGTATAIEVDTVAEAVQYTLRVVCPD
jgi:hypothetical protein